MSHRGIFNKTHHPSLSSSQHQGSSFDSKQTTRIQRPQDKHYVAVMYSFDMSVGTLRRVTVHISTVHVFTTFMVTHGSADNPSLNGTLRHQDLDLALLRGARLASRLPACDRLHVWTHPWRVSSFCLTDLMTPSGRRRPM